MRRALTMLAVTAVAAASFAAFAGAASAGVSPPGAKTGTTGAVTFAGASCTAGSFTGTWASSPTISIDMQLAFSGCRKVGGLPITVACANTAVLTATGTTVSDVTPLSLTRLSCRISVTGAPTCNATVSGSVVASYSNTSGALTISATGQALTISGSTCTTFPNGATSMSAASYRRVARDDDDVLAGTRSGRRAPSPAASSGAAACPLALAARAEREHHLGVRRPLEENPMRRILTILAAVAVIAGAFAGTAAATVTPTGAKTGTGGAVVFSGFDVNCTSSSFTSTWASPTAPPYTISTDLQLRFGGTCLRLGGLGVRIACTNTSVLTAIGATIGGGTPLSITAVSCAVSLTGSPACNATLSGSVGVTFFNTTSRLSVSTSAQALTVSGSTCPSTLQNGATDVTASGGTAPEYTVAPATTMSF